MARTTNITLKQRVEKRVIEKLTVKPSTLSELSELTGDNYHTIRRVLKALEEQGFAYPAGYRQGAMIYKLTEPDPKRPNNSIPVTKGRTGPIKITAFLDQIGKESNSRTAEAATSLPRNVSRILMAALRHSDSNGKYDIDKNLKNIRLEMETDLTQLRTMVSYFESILQADVLWNSHKIQAIPYDESFDRDKVIEAYKYYYPED